MNTTKAEEMVREEPVPVETDELSIDEDFDLGGDPYNSTGRHVIIKSRIELED